MNEKKNIKKQTKGNNPERCELFFKNGLPQLCRLLDCENSTKFMDPSMRFNINEDKIKKRKNK